MTVAAAWRPVTVTVTMTVAVAVAVAVTVAALVVLAFFRAFLGIAVFFKVCGGSHNLLRKSGKHGSHGGADQGFQLSIFTFSSAFVDNARDFCCLLQE